MKPRSKSTPPNQCIPNNQLSNPWPCLFPLKYRRKWLQTIVSKSPYHISINPTLNHVFIQLSHDLDVQNFIKHPYGTSTLTTFHSPTSQNDTFPSPTRTTCSHQPPYRKIQGGKTNTHNTRSCAHILGEQKAKTFQKV